MNGYTEIVKILAPLTDNPNAAMNNGDTPIHKAASRGHTEIVKILVPLTNNPNAPDKHGRTPIYSAAWNGHTEIVKILTPLTYNPNIRRKCLKRKFVPSATSSSPKQVKNFRYLSKIHNNFF